MIAKSHRWQKTALAAATTALFGLLAPNALALSLGRITVQSALGEALRAEIDIGDINAEEAASLKASVASPEAFRLAGLEYNPAIANLKATLHKRSDGRSYLQLSSARPINEPFVDLIVETSWATGRIVRDYTMLFDPPNLRSAARAPETPAQIPARSTGSSATVAPPPVAPPTARQRVEPRVAPSKAPAGSISAKAAGPGNGVKQLSVRPGDTASKIANATKPANVSLDQMLVALLRSNPDAFAGNNVNRVKAGAILSIPTQEQITATPAPQATQIIVAQSKDFNDFRRKLATYAPGAQVAATDRTVRGVVQAKVEDKKPGSTAPDKLTLSKGPLQNQSADDQLAKEKAVKDAATRAADISKNISDLNKLGTASSSLAPTPGASAPVPAVATLPAPAVAASVTASAATQAPAASAAVAASKATAVAAAKAAALAAPKPEPGLFDSLMENPLLAASAAGLLALLAFFGFQQASKRKQAPSSGFKESRLRPDSFFGASGGQRVDTSDNPPTGSSMVYSPSQLDAVDNVDPVAEADVYLAYGRHLQAEEILKDALQANPERIAIHQKLLAIFAKRSDTKSFERIAALAFQLTKGQGVDWERICELGLSIDTTNPLYLPGGHPDKSKLATALATPAASDTQPPASTQPAPIQASMPPPSASTDLDFDLDFSVDPDVGKNVAKTPSAQATGAPTAVSLDMNPQPNASFVSSGPAPLAASTETPAAANFDMLKFDLGSLSLDLDTTAEPEDAAKPVGAEDPLATKLALAEEFRAIGDDDGARALINEVLSEASGEMKVKAQQALGKLA